MNVQHSVKPRLRGVVHQYAFLVSLAAGAVLIATSEPGRARFAATVYVVGLSGLLGASALYHRINWSEVARRWLRRLDHSMIFVLIAGTYTPFALVVLHGSLSVVVLAVMWSGALAGMVLQLLWVDAPKWLSAAIYVALGWVMVSVLPAIFGSAGWPVGTLLIAGGLVYTVGAVVYALRRPDPNPTVFGYHEIFHVLVVVAAAAQFVAVAWVTT